MTPRIRAAIAAIEALDVESEAISPVSFTATDRMYGRYAAAFAELRAAVDEAGDPLALWLVGRLVSPPERP